MDSQTITEDQTSGYLLNIWYNIELKNKICNRISLSYIVKRNLPNILNHEMR